MKMSTYYHPFSEEKYRWDKVCKSITAEWVRHMGWEVIKEPEVYKHDLVIFRDDIKKILETEARNMVRFNMVWNGLYDKVHAPTRRFTYSDSDAQWILSYPMGIMSGDRRVYRVEAHYAKEAFEAGDVEIVSVENKGWEKDSFVLVPRKYYEFMQIPQKVWDEWHRKFSEGLFDSFKM